MYYLNPIYFLDNRQKREGPSFIQTLFKATLNARVIWGVLVARVRGANFCLTALGEGTGRPFS